MVSKATTSRRRLCLAGLALPFAVLASGGVRAADPAPVVETIEFAGLNNLQETPLRRALSLTAGEPFAAAEMEADRKALLALGFFRSVSAAQRTQNGRTQITYRLAELPPVLHIRVSGNSVVERRAIQGVITTRLGQVLCLPQLQEDVRAIERLYRERGYVARLDDKPLDEATRTGIIGFAVMEVRIDAVDLEGGSEKLRERARRELQEVAPGLYQPEAVSEDQQRLLQVKGVRGAVARVEPSGPGRVRIHWTLNPAKS
jgi:hemolysin activation/secretion protein